MRTHGRRQKTEGGYALVAVMMVMVLLMAAAASLHTGTLADTSLRGAHQVATAGFYAAEAGVNRGMGTYRDLFLQYKIPSGSDFNLNTFSLGPRTVTYQLSPVAAVQGVPTVVPAGRQFAGLTAQEYQYTAIASSQLHTGDTEVNLGTQFNVDYIPLFQFLTFYNSDLEVLPGPTMILHGPIHTNGNMYVNDSSATLQIADCGSTYSAPNYCPGSIPKVQISMVGNLYRGRSDANSCSGTVTISKLTDTNHDGVLDTQSIPCGSGTTQVSASTISTFLGSIQTHHARIAVPNPTQFTYNSADPDSYWQHADLRIVLDMTTTHRDTNHRYAIYVADGSGNVDVLRTAYLQAFMLAKPGRIFYNDFPLTTTAGAYSNTTSSATCASSTHCNHGNYDPAFASDQAVYPCWQSDLWAAHTCTNGDVANSILTGGTLLAPGAVTARKGGFWNNREQSWVGMLNINLHDLLAWNRTAGANQMFDPADTTDGGLVLFFTVIGPESNTIPVGPPKRRYGVRVFGSSDLDFPSGLADPTGATIVSDQAIYLEGNYNVGTVAHPWMPSAFIGDAINLLSAGWTGTGNGRNDYQARLALSGATRPAADTTMNAAFLGGTDVTNGSTYSGGFENYPRFHEAWDFGGPGNGLSTLTYRGSFVSLGKPLHNNGAWPSNGNAFNMYNPPNRNWDFDVNFMDTKLLPPMTPRAVTVEQILFTENFR